MEVAKGRSMAEKGAALRKAKERARKEDLTMARAREGAEEGAVVAEVYECWREERWQHQGQPQVFFSLQWKQH